MRFFRRRCRISRNDVEDTLLAIVAMAFLGWVLFFAFQNHDREPLIPDPSPFDNNDIQIDKPAPPAQFGQ
jgi:hypothetical protein